MKKLFRHLRDSRFKYNPLVSVNIHKDHLLHNFKYYTTHFPDLMFAPVLKSNAYGHGYIEVGSILDAKRAPFFVVDSYHEALILRNEGIKSPLLIIGYTPVETVVNNRLSGLMFTIMNDEVDDYVKFVNKPTRFHIKFDTGMHRQGLSLDSNGSIVPRGTIDNLLSNKNIKIVGICSHLADADNTGSLLNNEQIQKWNQLVDEMSKIIPDIEFYHLSATGGVNNVPRGTIHEKTNTIRLGIGLYGHGERYKHLKPVMSVNTVITSIRDIKKGDKVGYEGSFVADKNMRIATIPMGYNEGVDRRLSNKGVVKIVPRGTMCRVIGKVSMNITSIDVSDLIDISVGDKVEVIGIEQSNGNSVMNIAKLCGTISYEILIHINQTLRRNCV
ncbi:MAG: alanine racemase [Patescibacteria group bacterium]